MGVLRVLLLGFALLPVPLALAFVGCGGDVFQSATGDDGGGPHGLLNDEAGSSSEAGTVPGDDAGPAGPLPCKQTGRGPTLLRVSAQAGCIDSTEVTKAQYKAFLDDTKDAGVPQPAECAWNTNFTPQYDWPPIGREDHPANNLDWCDAWSFCRWAGKRLCGDPGGGPTKSAKTSQWYLACSAAGTKFPYGNTFGPTTCNGCASQPNLCGKVEYNKTVPVASKPACVGGAPGLFDMSGNVEEWENYCTPYGADGGDDDLCISRGGGWPNQAEADLACDAVRTRPRNSIFGETGFRCCGKD